MAVEPSGRAKPDVGPLLSLKGSGCDAARALTSASNTYAKGCAQLSTIVKAMHAVGAKACTAQ